MKRGLKSLKAPRSASISPGFFFNALQALKRQREGHKSSPDLTRRDATDAILGAALRLAEENSREKTDRRREVHFALKSESLSCLQMRSNTTQQSTVVLFTQGFPPHPILLPRQEVVVAEGMSGDYCIESSSWQKRMLSAGLSLFRAIWSR